MHTKTLNVASVSLTSLILIGCGSTGSQSSYVAPEPTLSRADAFTISSNNNKALVSTDEMTMGATVYDCGEYTPLSPSNPIMISFGFANSDKANKFGFVAYSNSSRAEYAEYAQRGLKKMWFFGDDQKATLDSDGMLALYDFYGVPTGESIEPYDLLFCESRQIK